LKRTEDTGWQGAVRSAVADATVALRGLEELAKSTTWHLTTAPPPSSRDRTVTYQ
jgi:hypothetical protein